MAVKKTDIDFWNKYKGFTYDQFSAWAKQNGYKSVKDIPNWSTETNKFVPTKFFSYFDKLKTEKAAPTRITKSEAAKADVGNAKKVIDKAANTSALNKLYTQYRSYTDSMKLYNKAADKKGMTNYQSQLDKVLQQIKALGGTVPKY